MGNMCGKPRQSTPEYQTERPLDNELPPAYAAKNTFPLTQSSIQAAHNNVIGRLPAVGGPAENPEDSPFAYLGQFDTIFLIDDSGSMKMDDDTRRWVPDHQVMQRPCRWKQTGDVISAIAPICTQFDRDGIDIWFLNHHNPRGGANGSYTGIRTAAEVQNIFNSVQPNGGTLTGGRLFQILDPYLQEVVKASKGKGKGRTTKIKPLNVIVITDGDASDDPEATIVHVAQGLDKAGANPDAVGIQFFQIGRDTKATKALRDLDDALSSTHEGMRDIVDTVPFSGKEDQLFTADFLLKTVLGAVTRRLDRRAA